jgi:uroporphyrinogen III methyltransferase/synthase
MIHQTLSGKKILVTRALHQATEFVQKIQAANGIPIIFPTIEIQPVSNWEKCDNAIDVLYMYDGLLFTSVNAVEYFFQRYKGKNRTVDDFHKKLVFAVGDKTKQMLDERGVIVTVIPEKFTSFDLVKTLEHEDLQGKSFLFPGGNLTKDTLSDNLRILGASVDFVPVYSTVIPDQRNVDTLHRQLMEHEIDIMTFLSPSAFRNFVTLFSIERTRVYTENTLIAAIGPTTSQMIGQFGIKTDIVPSQSTIEALVEAMGNYFRQQKVKNDK